MNRSVFHSRSSCPACASRDLTEVFSREYADPRLRQALEGFYREVGGLEYEALLGQSYVLDRCRRCGILCQKHVPADRLLEELYERWIDPEKAFARHNATITPARRMQIAQGVALSLSLVKPTGGQIQALDYGCGWGEWAAMIAAFGAISWGTELSATRRAHCTALGIRMVDDTELPDARFDFINADQVFEHLPHPRKTLQLLTQKLSPHGVIRIAVPNGWRIERRLRRFDEELRKPRLGGLNPVAPLEHLNCFRTRSLVALAASCGLRRVRPPWHVLAATMHLPRGWRARLKAAAMPFYLRSSFSTQLFFSP